MADRPTCPHCLAVHETAARPGTLLLCAGCGELFNAGDPPRVVAAEEVLDAGPVAVAPERPPHRPREPKPAAGRNSVLIGLAVLLLACGLGTVGGVALWLIGGRDKPDDVAKGDNPDHGAAPAPAPAPPTPKPADPAGPNPGPRTPPEPPPPPKAGRDVPDPLPPGARTRVREVRRVRLPSPPPPTDRVSRFKTRPWERSERLPVLAFSGKHDLLFALRTGDVVVYDLKADRLVGTQPAKEVLVDLSLSADEAALFAADFGGQASSGHAIRPSHVHRFDLAVRTWDVRPAPKVARRVEAVDAARVLLLEEDQQVDLTLNRWDGDGVRELSRVRCGFHGDIEFDPRTGRAYHGDAGTSSPRVLVHRVGDDTLGLAGDSGDLAVKGGGGSVVLSADGSRLYFGQLQVDATDVRKSPVRFPEIVIAAARDVAFGSKGYYRAETGEKLGEYGFDAGVRRAQGWDPGAQGSAAVAADGRSVWVYDPGTSSAVQFGIEGEK